MREAVDAHAHIVGLKDAHARLVIALAKRRMVLHLLQRAIFAMRIDDQHRGTVVRHHQLFEQHAGQITFAAARAGDDGEMGARKTFDIQRDRHRIRRAAEQAAQVGAAPFALFALAQAPASAIHRRQ